MGTGRLVLIGLPLQRNSWTSGYKCVVLPVLLWRKKTGNKEETTQHTPSSLSDRPLKNNTEPPATHTYSYCSLPQCVFINRVHPQTILKQKNTPCHSTLGTIFAPNTKTRILIIHFVNVRSFLTQNSPRALSLFFFFFLLNQPTNS